MRVAVTGGTGFVGAHSVHALRGAGHDVRLLVRRPELVRSVLGPLGVEVDDVVIGDVTDPGAVDRLLDGCDAVLHTAALVAVDRSQMDQMWRTNVEGARLVLEGAAARGLDPIVQVSSYAALFPSPDPVIGPDSPVATCRTPYGRSKAAAEHLARRLQAAGAPVVITYPSTVVGPPAGPRRGEAAEGWDVLLRMGTTIWVRGNLPVVDVRDVAAVHAAAMRPAQGPRRYLCGGHFVPFGDLLGMLERGSERRLRRVPVPGAGLRAAGWLTDRISTVLPVPAILTHEASIVLTRAQPTDDSATHSDLKVHWRSTDESIAAALETAPTHEEA